MVIDIDFTTTSNLHFSQKSMKHMKDNEARQSFKTGPKQFTELVQRSPYPRAKMPAAPGPLDPFVHPMQLKTSNVQIFIYISF